MSVMTVSNLAKFGRLHRILYFSSWIHLRIHVCGWKCFFRMIRRNVLCMLSKRTIPYKPYQRTYHCEIQITLLNMDWKNLFIIGICLVNVKGYRQPESEKGPRQIPRDETGP